MTEEMSTMGDTLDRGLRFGSALYEVVHEYGPAHFTNHQKEALGRYLLDSAVEWVRAQNRQSRTDAEARLPS